MEKNRSRVSWWKSKLVSQKRKQTKLTTRQSWIERVARGRERVREKVQIPVYGDLKFTNSEMDALSLPPKHAEYERVTKDKTRHQMRVTQTKTRYGWKSLLYDVDGNVIEETLEDRDGNLIVSMTNENADEDEDAKIEREVKEVATNNNYQNSYSDKTIKKYLIK